MHSFFALSGILSTSGIALALYVPNEFSVGGWLTGAVLLIFAVLDYLEARSMAWYVLLKFFPKLAHWCRRAPRDREAIGNSGLDRYPLA
jgi:hypothetical protein